MLNNPEQEQGILPEEEERRRILERAGVVLAQARALCETLDRTQDFSRSVESQPNDLPRMGLIQSEVINKTPPVLASHSVN